MILCMMKLNKANLPINEKKDETARIEEQRSSTIASDNNDTKMHGRQKGFMIAVNPLEFMGETKRVAITRKIAIPAVVRAR